MYFVVVSFTWGEYPGRVHRVANHGGCIPIGECIPWGGVHTHGGGCIPGEGHTLGVHTLVIQTFVYFSCSYSQ